MKVLLLEGDNVYDQLINDFKKLIKEAVKEALQELKDQTVNSEQTTWISGLEAMKILNCKRDKLNQLRMNNNVKSSHHGRKILYYKPSLHSFLEKHVQKY